MHRQPLLNMLQQYSQLHPDEANVVAQIEQLVTSSSDCFQRTCRPGHVTGSAWILSHDRSRCLLVHHRKLNRWLQPGGHADGESDIANVALREVREETGLTDLELPQPHGELLPLDIDVHQIPARMDKSGALLEDTHQHHDIRFLVIAADGQELVLSDESHDVRWFSHEQLLEVTDEESVLRMLRKAGPLTTGQR
jgi:8-oxo-dGTP pyrophosphatase MutT (NUDIX family)